MMIARVQSYAPYLPAVRIISRMTDFKGGRNMEMIGNDSFRGITDQALREDDFVFCSLAHRQGTYVFDFGGKMEDSVDGAVKRIGTDPYQ